MRLLEELSGIIFRQIASPYLRTFREKSPEKILRKSLEVIDPDVQNTLQDYVRNCLSSSGSFKDRGGKPDIYYTLFGYFLAESLDLKDLFPAIGNYTKNEINRNNLGGVHLHCAAILFSKLYKDKVVENGLRDQIRQQLKKQNDKQPAYRAFISLLACYYLNDFQGLYIIKKQLEKLNSNNPLPSSVVAALLVLQSSFGKPVEELKQNLLSLLSESGGFKAVKSASVPDLLSTAVSLYALRFAGQDLRLIKPGCLDFIDSLYNEGGFSASIIDPDPDIEYTFYGLLALGSLAD